MERVWLGFGSNLGDSRKILQQAWQKLGQEETIRLITFSAPYASEPVGMESDNRFLNAVGILETNLSPHDLLGLLQKVEKGFGRKVKTGMDEYQDRLLDLDILFFSDIKSTESNLLLPHPHIADRLFVLAPLAEIDPEHRHPRTGKRVQQMYDALVQKMKDGITVLQEVQQETWMSEKETKLP